MEYFVTHTIEIGKIVIEVIAYSMCANVSLSEDIFLLPRT